MKTKRVFLIAAMLILAAAMIVGISFIWASYLRAEAIVLTGDANIEVKGWYCLANDFKSVDFKNNGTELVEASNNELKELGAGQCIAYKFRVTNLGENDATVSIRTNNTFDYIFQLFEQYAGGDESIIDSALYGIAAKNNGRLSFVMDKIYYEYESSGDITHTSPQLNDPDADMYLWKYGNGEYFIGDNQGNALCPDIAPILVPGAIGGNMTNVNIYITLIQKQSAEAIKDYKQWLLGNEGSTGTGYSYGANLLGYQKDISDQSNQINTYLQAYYDHEIKSAANEPTLNIKVDYFEFSGKII